MIPVDIRQGIKDALVLYYSGDADSIKDAFDQSSIARSTYYKYKSDHPDVVDEIEKDALSTAARQVDLVSRSFSNWQVMRSSEIQRMATALLSDRRLFDELQHIIFEDHRTVTINDKDKVIVNYPRDKMEAIKQLQQLARGGVLPEHFVPPQHHEERQSAGILNLGEGPSPEFSSIEVTTKDGRRLKASIDDPDIIEGEVDEEV